MSLAISYTVIDVSYKNGIQIIRMNRPSRKNAMNSQMMIEISQSLKEAELDNRVVLVVLTGTGDYYCSGNDMKVNVMDEESYDEMCRRNIEIGRKFVGSLIDFKKILVAIVNGPAIGIAVTTLALCDMVYASENASFWTPFASLGLSAEGCSSYLFPKIMGISKAGSMLHGNVKISAKEAKDLNLVSEVYTSSEIDTILWPELVKISKQSVPSLIANKRLMRKWDRELFHNVNEAEWDELRIRFMSEHFANAVMNFTQRSKI